jgi:hypothetical protein
MKVDVRKLVDARETARRNGTIYGWDYFAMYFKVHFSNWAVRIFSENPFICDLGIFGRKLCKSFFESIGF